MSGRQLKKYSKSSPSSLYCKRFKIAVQVKARIAELERDNEEMEAAVQALLTFLPENLGRSVKDIEALRQTGIGVELGVELFLLQNERFKEDAQFKTQELLPFEKVPMAVYFDPGCIDSRLYFVSI